MQSQYNIRRELEIHRNYVHYNAATLITICVLQSSVVLSQRVITVMASSHRNSIMIEYTKDRTFISVQREESFIRNWVTREGRRDEHRLMMSW